MAGLAVGIKGILLIYGLLYFAQIVKRFPVFHWAVAFISFVLSATFFVPISKSLITGIRDYG